MKVFTTLLELAGLAAIAAGCFLIWLPLGLIAVGAAMILTGYLAGR